MRDNGDANFIVVLSTTAVILPTDGNKGISPGDLSSGSGLFSFPEPVRAFA